MQFVQFFSPDIYQCSESHLNYTILVIIHDWESFPKSLLFLVTSINSIWTEYVYPYIRNDQIFVLHSSSQVKS